MWLHPVTPQTQDMGLWLQQFYATTEPLPSDFMSERVDEAAQERDWT